MSQPVSTGASAAAEISRGRAAAALALLYLAAAGIRFAVSGYAGSPVIFNDEWLYFEEAKSLSEWRGVVYEGSPQPTPAWGYPLLLAPVMRLPAEAAHTAALLLNAFIANTLIFFVYALAREIGTRRQALAAAGLAALFPSLGFTATIMAENLFYPLFVLAMHLCLRAMVRPTAAARVAAGLACGLTFHVKPQGLFLPIIFGISVLFFEAQRALSQAEGQRLKQFAAGVGRHWLTAAAWAAGVAPRFLEIVFFERHPNPISVAAFLGGYYGRAMGDFPFRWGAFGRTFAEGLGTAAVGLGFLPAAAGIAGLSKGNAEEATEERKRGLAILGLAALVFMCAASARHTLIADEWTRIHERYFSAAYPILIALFCAGRAGARARTHARRWLFGAAGLAALGLAIYAVNEDLWTLPADTPTGVGGALFLHYGVAAWPKAVFLALVLAGAGIIAEGRGRRPREAAGIAVLWLGFNFGFYAVYAGPIAGFDLAAREAGERIRDKIPEGDEVFILEDALHSPLLWHAGFWLRSSFRYAAAQRQSWFSFPLEVGEQGRIMTGEGSVRSWLLAASEWKFDRAPEFWAGDAAVYRLGRRHPLSIDLKQVTTLRAAAPDAPEWAAFRGKGVEDYQRKMRLTVTDENIPAQWRAGEKIRATIWVRNDSSFPLPTGAIAAGIGYHWSDPERTGNWNAVVWDDGNHAVIEEALAPGEEARVRIHIVAPKPAGEGWMLTLAPLARHGGLNHWTDERAGDRALKKITLTE